MPLIVHGDYIKIHLNFSQNTCTYSLSKDGFFDETNILHTIKDVPDELNKEGWKLVCGLNSNTKNAPPQMINWEIIKSCGYDYETVKKIVENLTRKCDIYWIKDLTEIVAKYM